MQPTGIVNSLDVRNEGGESQMMLWSHSAG